MRPMSLPTPSVQIAREQNHLAWDPAIPPVASVGSGDVVEFDCLDASNGEITADSTTSRSRRSTSTGSTRSPVR